MKTLVQSVMNFNGMIYYGVDKNNNQHDKKWLISKKSGQVAIIFDNNLVIQEAKLFSNREKAYDYIFKNVKSEGILG